MWSMGEQLLTSSILDQFINSHEQSYDEFLNTFTYLVKEEEGKTTEGGKVNSLSKTFSASELSNRSEEDGLPGRSEEMGVSPPPYVPKESEVEEHLDLEDVDTDEKMCSGAGESSRVPLLGKLTEQETPVKHPRKRPSPSTVVLLGDDVQPFSLDEGFDYDNVALTPKFAEAELKAIVGLSEEKKMGTDVKSAQADN